MGCRNLSATKRSGSEVSRGSGGRRNMERRRGNQEQGTERAVGWGLSLWEKGTENREPRTENREPRGQ
jgi:hypothetical protein